MSIDLPSSLTAWPAAVSASRGIMAADRMRQVCARQCGTALRRYLRYLVAYHEDLSDIATAHAAEFRKLAAGRGRTLARSASLSAFAKPSIEPERPAASIC
jgi:hypothetical protein